MSKKYTDSEILDEIRRVNELVEGPVTCSEFNELSNMWVKSVQFRFGSWNEGKEEAGVPTLEHAEPKSNPHWKGGSSYEQGMEFIQEIKEDSSCQHCGEDRPRALQFHHRNPDDKLMAVSEMPGSYCMDRIAEEIEKCELICANCHMCYHR